MAKVCFSINSRISDLLSDIEKQQSLFTEDFFCARYYILFINKFKITLYGRKCYSNQCSDDEVEAQRDNLLDVAGIPVVEPHLAEQSDSRVQVPSNYNVLLLHKISLSVKPQWRNLPFTISLSIYH